MPLPAKAIVFFAVILGYVAFALIGTHEDAMRPALVNVPGDIAPVVTELSYGYCAGCGEEGE